MPRTPKQIAEYIDYYKDKPKEEREWAFRNLAESEGKTVNQLVGVANGYKNGRKSASARHCKSNPIPDELREQVREAVRAGMSNVDIMAKFGLSHNTVTRIKSKMRDEGETLPETRGKKPGQKPAAEKQPEAYPGQINDDEPEIEDDVKAYVPGEIRTEPKEPTASECKEPEIIKAPPQKEPEQPETLWKALSEKMCDFAVGTFDKGTRITSVFWSEDDSSATVCMKTPDDRIIQITMEER